MVKSIKPRRRESDYTVPNRSEIEQRVSGWQNGSDPCKKAPRASSAQEYEDMDLDLPIRSMSDPGTPGEQHKRWLSDDPTRYHKIQKVIDKWVVHFTILKGKPVALERFYRKGKVKLTWWRSFLIETDQISDKDIHHA